MRLKEKIVLTKPNIFDLKEKMWYSIYPSNTQGSVSRDYKNKFKYAFLIYCRGYNSRFHHYILSGGHYIALLFRKKRT